MSQQFKATIQVSQPLVITAVLEVKSTDDATKFIAYLGEVELGRIAKLDERNFAFLVNGYMNREGSLEDAAQALFRASHERFVTVSAMKLDLTQVIALKEKS